jgi:glycosyltransferase involved in cell wall biosynthesis
MDKPIKVLQVMSSLSRAGAQAYVMNIYRNINHDEIEFDFVVHNSEIGDYENEVIDLGGKIFRIPSYKGYNHFKYKKAWNDFFTGRKEYKLIHGHVRSTASIYLKIAKKYGLTTIAHSHNTSSGSGLKGIFKNILQYPIRYTADYLFACSQTAGEWLYGKRATKSNRFKVFNNAIDAEKYRWNKKVSQNTRDSLGIPNDAIVVGHIGRFHPQKNHNQLINIFKDVKRKKENSFLLIIGDGELRDDIEKKIQTDNLKDSVILTGVRPDVPELLQAMDVFLFPSLYEGLPVTLIEAQASGLPCIISSTITKEVAITDLMDFINLDDSVSNWSDKVLMRAKEKRKDTLKKISEAGYDIKMIANEYQSFCLNK